MKISLNWLNDYVQVNDFLTKPQELAQLLTSAGLEVDGFENPAKTFANVVVGHIIELGRHPNADKLTLCQVDVGDGKTRQIVCGAKNHKQGDKVVVALVGAVLPGDFVIKLSKIRDVESQGMLCSESELGFKAESEGIVLLPKDAPVGRAFADYWGLQDVIFEINVTPNRADCLSHVGLARELSCLLDRELKLPAAKVKAGTAKVKDLIKVELKDKELCPRYAGRSVLNVKIGPSPDWLSKRLKSVGLNSINNVVDVTNYVMMEYGQPLHAFDAAELQGAKLTIEKSHAKEKFKTFDGTEYELTGEELTIRDGSRAVALAGVIGGLNSGVTNKTTNIFLEAAHFNPRGVRRSARRLGITTDSSHRFSRGTDPENVVEAMNRAVQLIQEVAGGEASKDHYDLYPSPQVREPILVRHKTLEERLGYPVDMADFASWMKRLQCKVSPAGKTKTKTVKGDCLVEAPTFRWDIEIEMDLVEEYARLNGYDKIPEIFPKVEAQPTDSVPAYYHELRLAQLLIAEGFLEARNYNFVSPKWQAGIVQPALWTQLGLPTGGEAVMVKNPLSEETSQMRQSLLPGLLTNLIYNYSHGSAYGALFETGAVFSKKDDQYQESQRLAGVLWGQPLNLWDKTAVPAVIDLKSRLESLVRRLRGQVQLRDLKSDQVPAVIHPGQVAGLFYEGRMIGVVGALHPEFREEHKIRCDAAVFELDFDALMRGQPRSAKSQKISRLPAVDRDLALLMPTKIHVGEVAREIEKAGAPLLQSVLVFDVFKGAGIPEGQHSVTFRMVFQDMESTLSDERLAQAMAQILTGIQKKFPEALPRS